MALIYSIGKNLVSKNEFEKLNQQGIVSNFVKSINTKEDFHFKLRGSDIHSNLIMKSLKLATGQVVQPSPIGIGKPLTVYIQHIYLGDDGNKDLLVTSSMKPITETKSAPRAINLLKKKAGKKEHIDFSAPDLGTPLVYYSPSVTESYTILTLEMILDRFNDEIFEQIGESLQTAGALPIFAAASQFLFSSGAISKLIGKIGESIFDGSPFFSVSEKLTFDFAGMPQTLPGQILLVNDEHEEYLLANYKLDEEGKLIPKSQDIPANEKYPYITIYLNGTPQNDYASFKPLTDSVDIIDRFFHLKTSNQQMKMDTLIKALGLYNDLSYRDKALKKKDQLDKMSPESDEYKIEKVIYDAYIKNIQNDLFKLK